MSKNILIIALALICFVSAYSQNKLLTIEDAAIGQYRKYMPEYLRQLQWIPNSNNYTYLKNGCIIECSVKNDNKKELVKLSDIETAFKNKKLNIPSQYSEYKWISNNLLKIETDDYISIYNIITNNIESYIKIDSIIQNIDFNNSSKLVAYTKSNNLFITNMQQYEKQITNESNTGIKFGKSVHREEFGIEKGTFWSNSGKKLAFYRMDESMVTEYPLVDIEPRIAKVNNIRYPMAGMHSHFVTIGVYNTETEKTIYLNTGKPDVQYLTNIAWSNDDKYIFVAILNPQQNQMKFNQYNADNGEFVKTLFEEENEKYVEPLHPAVFLKKSNDKFIWQSQRDGYNHLYLYDLNGILLKQITKGNWVVTDFLGFNENETEAYYISTETSPLNRNVYSVNIQTGKTKCLTIGDGIHSANFTSDNKYFIDEFSSLSEPNTYNLLNSNGEKIKEILKSKNTLTEINMPEMQMFTIKSADGKTDLYGRLIKPINFDKNKKYPAILYVYGGPHAQLVDNSWLGGAPLWDYYMAQKGYVVITIDNRGSANRGFEFESVIHRNVGYNEALDQMEAVKYLKSLGYVDEKRIGIHGWSYGGFMTINLMTTFPDVFKTGVAGGPVIDWKYYEVMYGERYMDTPQENPEGYKNTSLLNKADKLKGNLLIIHGYIDNTVVLQNSLSFIQKCIENGVMVDYFLYPEHEHNVRGMDRIHLMKKITKYFDDFL